MIGQGRIFGIAAGSEAHAHAAALSAAALSGLILATLALVTASGGGRSRGSLHRNRKVGWDRIEIERFANESAERDNEIVHMDRTSGNQLTRSLLGQANMLFCPQQDE